MSSSSDAWSDGAGLDAGPGARAGTGPGAGSRAAHGAGPDAGPGAGTDAGPGEWSDTVAEVLAPLAARYVDWLRLPASATSDTSDEDPTLVRAMPMVLRVERAEPPGRTPLLEAAAAAAVVVCLDPRCAPGGEWHDEVSRWVGGRIRKVTRRARGAHWAAVQELPGVTVAVPGASGPAEVRALVPGLVSEAPREVSRLQIAGTDLPPDEPGEPIPGLPVVWLNPVVELTVGKAAAQVGHATMIMAAALPVDELREWHAGGLRCSVRVASERGWRSVLDAAARGRSTVLVRDAGFTEVAPGTVTCAAQWPTR
jgi:peptidyl-tRNA hydrolase